MLKWLNTAARRVCLPNRATTGNLGALAVPDDDKLWCAVHQIIDAAEAETILAARASTRDANACISAVGAGEGIALVRTKLYEARELAIKGKQ